MPHFYDQFKNSNRIMLSSIVAEIGSKHKNGIFDSMQTIHIGQSYKASTSINYDSRVVNISNLQVVNISNLLVITTFVS